MKQRLLVALLALSSQGLPILAPRSFAQEILNRGFQNCNYLVLNMAAWYDGGKVVSEFR